MRKKSRFQLILHIARSGISSQSDSIIIFHHISHASQEEEKKITKFKTSLHFSRKKEERNLLDTPRKRNRFWNPNSTKDILFFQGRRREKMERNETIRHERTSEDRGGIVLPPIKKKDGGEQKELRNIWYTCFERNFLPTFPSKGETRRETRHVTLETAENCCNAVFYFAERRSSLHEEESWVEECNAK